MFDKKARQATYRETFQLKHGNRVAKYHADYREENRDQIASCKKVCGDNAMKSWEGYIPTQTQCQVCGRDIFFNHGPSQHRIHFDHRHGGAEVIKAPSAWLRKGKRTPKKEAIWESCDFGMLCLLCNRALPTKDRALFLSNVTKYVKQTQRENL